MRTLFLHKGLTKLNSTCQNFAASGQFIPPSPSDGHILKGTRFLQICTFFCIFHLPFKPAKKENRRKKSGGFAASKTHQNYFPVLFSATFMFSSSSIRLSKVGCNLATYSCSKVLMRCSMRAICLANSPLVLSCAILSSSNR